MQYESNGQVQGSSLLDKPRVPVGDVWALFERDCKDIIANHERDGKYTWQYNHKRDREHIRVKHKQHRTGISVKTPPGLQIYS